MKKIKIVWGDFRTKFLKFVMDILKKLWSGDDSAEKPNHKQDYLIPSKVSRNLNNLEFFKI